SEISPKEVYVLCNGVEVGTVPPDTADPDREVEAVLPPEALRRNELNAVVFDNVKNPPENETWRIANPWIEVIPIPEVRRTDVVARARDFARQGGDYFKLRDVGAENL